MGNQDKKTVSLRLSQHTNRDVEVLASRLPGLPKSQILRLLIEHVFNSQDLESQVATVLKMIQSPNGKDPDLPSNTHLDSQHNRIQKLNRKPSKKRV